MHPGCPGGKLVAVAFYQDEAALEGGAEAVKPMRTEVESPAIAQARELEMELEQKK